MHRFAYFFLVCRYFNHTFYSKIKTIRTLARGQPRHVNITNFPEKKIGVKDRDKVLRNVLQSFRNRFHKEKGEKSPYKGSEIQPSNTHYALPM